MIAAFCNTATALAMSVLGWAEPAEVNNLNLRETPEGLFAHVVTANQRTFDLVQAALVSSGLPSSAINLAVVPSDIGGAASERASSWHSQHL